MRLLALLLLLGGAVAAAAPRTMTLKEAVDLALRQNPSLVMARLDAQKAGLEVQATREGLLPRFVAGSGMAYTYGMPMSVEGSAPTVVQARAIRSIYHAPQRYMTSMARELAAGAAHAAENLKDEVALRTAVLYLDLERAAQAAEMARAQIESLKRIEAAVRLRVDEGRELAIEGKRAAVNLARARQRAAALESARRAHAQALALVLGLEPEQDLMPAREARPEPALPESEQDTVRAALDGHPEIRRIEATIRARKLEQQVHKAARQPKIDLLAQYGLLARFNNYDQFFNRFQRHNMQLGAAFAIPLFANPADEARAAQASIEARRLEAELRSARGRIEGDARSAWRQLHDADLAREVALADLELAREQVTLLLAQSGQGRATIQQLEQARVRESDAWMALLEARYEAERARYHLLRQANRLTASLP